MLLQGERLDKVAGSNLSIIQSDRTFAYSIDAVLLGRFAYVPIQKGRILDLCSGNGIVGLVLSTRTKALIDLVEVQAPLHDMAERTIRVNQLEKQVTSLCFDLKETKNKLPHSSYDTVTCNPPYFQLGGNKQVKEQRALSLARHELACTLADVVQAGSYALKYGGKLALVHRPERLADMMEEMRNCNIEPKRLRFCHPRGEANANIVLLEGIKGGKPGLVCEPPLIVYNKDQYTPAFQREYFGR
ncbi:hypothetical protein J26TS2_43380 [Shouchella clausii]|uniref:tRNA1(Val) (adenine(37)-N6)-methyltransferase n=1 Tax=Shouchella tritolerans TaxID=2979466 RepID=UPI0007878CEF|nr:tRNA1(Val) (adenine(37)-N6)-methyltransferase [Shouchella tritolerans]GIN14471.1 hypothetical protein J26TS2_43380 [Shouchella clausii]